jgi:hypothetical protein
VRIVTVIIIRKREEKGYKMFIKLTTTEDNCAVSINVDRIVVMKPKNGGSTDIHLTGKILMVKELYKDIMEQISLYEKVCWGIKRDG